MRGTRFPLSNLQIPNPHGSQCAIIQKQCFSPHSTSTETESGTVRYNSTDFISSYTVETQAADLYKCTKCTIRISQNKPCKLTPYLLLREQCCILHLFILGKKKIVQSADFCYLVCWKPFNISDIFWVLKYIFYIYVDRVRV